MKSGSSRRTKNVALIAAGGTGSRLNIEGGKQLLVLAGKPVLMRSIQYFQDSNLIDEIVVVIAQQSINECRELVQHYAFSKVTHVVASGTTRQHSVANGLAVIRDAAHVLIHDGARPLMNPGFIGQIIETLKQYEGAIIGMPVTDTIKVVDNQGIIERTLDRSTLIAAQTPQGFRYDVLKKAYELDDKHRFTDDASMVEHIGGKVKVLEGSAENIKITHAPDLIIAEMIMNKRNQGV